MWSLLHLSLSLILASYLFIVRTRNKLDFFYVFSVYGMFLHWTFLNGECIVSYWSKKKQNRDYIAGQNSFHHDFHRELNDVPPFVLRIYNILCFSIILYNISVVSTRNYVPLWVAIAFIVLNVSYYVGSYLFKNLHKNRNFHFFQDIIKYSLIIWAFLFMAFYRFV